MPRFPRLPVFLVTGLAVVAVGCGDDDDDDDDAAVTPPAATQTASPSGTTAPSADGAPAADTATIVRAIATAEDAVDGGRAFEFDADVVNGTPVLEVKVGSDRGDAVTEVAVGPDGEEVLGTRSDDDNADARQAFSVPITLTQAVEEAEAEAGGRALDAVELENQPDLAYEASYQGATDDDELTVAVDAGTGDVLRTETDD